MLKIDFTEKAIDNVYQQFMEQPIRSDQEKAPCRIGLPRSERTMTPFGNFRRHKAILSASHTSTAVMRSAHCPAHPTGKRFKHDGQIQPAFFRPNIGNI